MEHREYSRQYYTVSILALIVIRVVKWLIAIGEWQLAVGKDASVTKRIFFSQ